MSGESLPKVCSKSAQSLLKIYKKSAENMLKSAESLPKVCQKSVKCLLKVCQKSAIWMPGKHGQGLDHWGDQGCNQAGPSRVGAYQRGNQTLPFGGGRKGTEWPGKGGGVGNNTTPATATAKGVTSSCNTTQVKGLSVNS